MILYPFDCVLKEGNDSSPLFYGFVFNPGFSFRPLERRIFDWIFSHVEARRAVLLRLASSSVEN
jgi:hypothetical protein